MEGNEKIELGYNDIDLDNLGLTNCLQTISHIKFPFLMNISLEDNRVSSIEALSVMWIPSVVFINLSTFFAKFRVKLYFRDC